MNVANLELCKALYEVSGWDYSTFWWFRDVPENRILLASAIQDDTGIIRRQICPAYDLGYLLRKLPVYSKVWQHLEGGWKAETFTGFDHIGAIADTPEDAACKLAIELFRQGILTKESK